MLYFYIPCKHQKTKTFCMFSWGKRLKSVKTIFINWCFQRYIKNKHCLKLVINNYGMLRLSINKISIYVWFPYICSISWPSNQYFQCQELLRYTLSKTSRYVTFYFFHIFSLVALTLLGTMLCAFYSNLGSYYFQILCLFSRKTLIHQL